MLGVGGLAVAGEIESGAKTTAGAGEHNDPTGRVNGELVEGSMQSLHQFSGESVQLVRTIERDLGDAIVWAGDLENGHGHIVAGRRLHRPVPPVGYGSTMAPTVTRRSAQIHRTLAPHRVGNDPTTLLTHESFWRATITPEGPGTLHLQWSAHGLDAESFGPGAHWLLERAEHYAGSGDPGHRFDQHAHPAIVSAQRDHPELRLSNGHCLYHTLLPTVIGQRVTAVEAHRSWRRLCQQYGEPAPGPYPLLLPPRPEVLRVQPSWRLHPLGIDRRRSDALAQLAKHADRLFALDDALPQQATALLAHIPGIGPWTIGAALGHALGDADAVAVGDFHLKNTIAWTLAGEPRASDDRMLELLEPYRGQRGRVIALLAAQGAQAPKYGARQRILPMERW